MTQPISIPKNCARKITTMHSKSAVPSMFKVAPRGRVKLLILEDTPTRLLVHSMVTGKVADEEAVEKAVSRAGVIAR